MKKLFLIGVLLFLGSSSFAQTNKTFFLGHSLVNFHMPNMVNKLSIAGARPFSYNANVGNGANLLFHWNNPTSGQGDSWNTTLPTGGFENFIITEAVPLAGHLQWSSTYRIADSLYRFAQLQNPTIRYYIYETWHCTNSGNGSTSGQQGYPCDWDPGSVAPWRSRLTTDLSKWESIADSINLIHPNQMLVIPAGQALGRLSDSIIAGNVSGISAMTDFFGDNIHLDMRGNYFIACVMYSVIHGVSPVGLPHQLTDEWGIPYAVFPTAEQAAIMQRIAWQTVCDYGRDGVSCNVTSVASNNHSINNLNIYPNPSNDFISIGANTILVGSTYVITDQTGRQVLIGKLNNETTLVDISSFSAGMYFFQVGQESKQTFKVVKK